MKNIKANQKGFTLVELIVVMCILGVLMGAILNLLQPTYKFFNSTKDMRDANDAALGIQNATENNIRYATQMFYLGDYEGVPQVTLGSDGATIGGKSYKHLLVVDNNHVRGLSDSSYDATSSSARRKSVKGAILKFDFGSTTGGINCIDFSKSTIFMQEDYYGDYTYYFDTSMSTIDGNRYFNMMIRLYTPTYSGGSYSTPTPVSYDLLKSDTTKYPKGQDPNVETQMERKVSLMNINLQSDGVTTYLDALNPSVMSLDGCYSGSAIDYTKYPKVSSAPDTCNDAQAEFYDETNTYTYIFYNSVKD